MTQPSAKAGPIWLLSPRGGFQGHLQYPPARVPCLSTCCAAQAVIWYAWITKFWVRQRTKELSSSLSSVQPQYPRPHLRCGTLGTPAAQRGLVSWRGAPPELCFGVLLIVSPPGEVPAAMAPRPPPTGGPGSPPRWAFALRPTGISRPAHAQRKPCPPQGEAPAGGEPRAALAARPAPDSPGGSGSPSAETAVSERPCGPTADIFPRPSEAKAPPAIGRRRHVTAPRDPPLPAGPSAGTGPGSAPPPRFFPR